jgi:hypothetical protein
MRSLLAAWSAVLGSALAQQQIYDPAAASVLPTRPAMLDQVGVRASRGFEGVGQERHAVESALRIDAIGEGPRLSGQPRAAHRSRAERVSKEAVDEGCLLPVLGDRGGGIEDAPLAL